MYLEKDLKFQCLPRLYGTAWELCSKVAQNFLKLAFLFKVKMNVFASGKDWKYKSFTFRFICASTHLLPSDSLQQIYSHNGSSCKCDIFFFFKKINLQVSKPNKIDFISILFLIVSLALKKPFYLPLQLFFSSLLHPPYSAIFDRKGRYLSLT